MRRCPLVAAAFLKEDMAQFNINFTTEDVRQYVREEVSTVSQSVLEAITTQKIDGEVFLEMDDECLHEIAPLGGDRLKLKKAIRQSLSEMVG